jgi:hypothetical protein
MNKDHKLLEEAYQSIYESLKEPLYFGPRERKEEFLNWLSKLNHEVHEDGSVSVNGDVVFEKIPLGQRIPFNFKEVTGTFNCNFCDLLSLEGSPKIVGGHFLCCGNKLTTLKGAPENVTGTFNCQDNDLTSPEGSPEYVGGYFMIYNNRIKSLKGAPLHVGESYDCDVFSHDSYREYVRNIRLTQKLSDDFSKDHLNALEDFS